MSTTELDTDFAQGVRAELAAIGTTNSILQRHQRRRRTLAIGLGALALVGATTGAAVIINNFPGTTTVAPLGAIVTATQTGTATIDLGAVPDEAAVVIIDVTCISRSGEVFVLTIPTAGSAGPGGAGKDCAVGESTMHVNDGLLPTDGTTSITISADPQTSWKATVQYATSSSSAWGVNANGQTFGVPNANGAPDLTPALASNGQMGYVVAEELLSIDGAGSVNVYESDGVTVIGQQEIVPAVEVPFDESQIPHFWPSDGDSE